MTSDQFLYYAIGAIAGIAIQYFLLRWIFDIGKRNRYLKAQAELLGKIAEKQGVPKGEIGVILDVAERWEMK